MIICKWPDPLVDHFQVTRVTGVTRGDRTEGGEEGKGEGGKRGKEGEGKLLRTDGSKALQEVLVDLKTPK